MTVPKRARALPTMRLPLVGDRRLRPKSYATGHAPFAGAPGHPRASSLGTRAWYGRCLRGWLGQRIRVGLSAAADRHGIAGRVRPCVDDDAGINAGNGSVLVAAGADAQNDPVTGVEVVGRGE